MKTSLLGFCIGSLVLMGCAQKEIIFTQEKICQAPIASIMLQNIVKKQSNTTISQGEFKDYLVAIIKNTNCLELVEQSQEDTYALNATYDIKVSDNTTKKMLSSEHVQTLNAQVILSISDQTQIRQEMGQSSIEIQNKKILGIGSGDKISREDEANAIKNSILIAIKNFISSIQTQDN